ncbi:MAG: OadG family protein [Candidatus Eremiobacteraeota bacterium]|nr:OadG family protein [Candidatus Eremiobacteraeota bacterium]
MAFVFGFLILLGLIGAALGVYAFMAPKKVPVLVTSPVPPPDSAEEDDPSDDVLWTNEAGSEFSGLSESARCDLIFAVAALDDDASVRLLVHALDDPSQTVALAAAHALARGGRLDEVRAYARSHDGPRSEELLQLLGLLA